MTIAKSSAGQAQVLDEVSSDDRFDNLDPKAVREKAGLPQTEMAALLGMGSFGYRQWEEGTRRPGGPAFRLLYLLNDNPANVIAALTENG